MNVNIAFFLNYISLKANQLAGPLTMSVCGNVKQAFTILLGIILFETQLSWLNVTGMIITFGGAVWYTRVELLEHKLPRFHRGVQV